MTLVQFNSAVGMLADLAVKKRPWEGQMHALRLELWQNAYVMLGTSAAALAGLLFVAVSLQAESIVRDPILRVRASANTTMTVILIIVSAIILVPQGVVAIGVELSTIAVVYIAWAVHRIIRLGKAGTRTPTRAVISIGINGLGVFAGLGLILGSEVGMYIVTIQYIVTLGWVIFNAWSLLLDANVAHGTAKT